MIRRWCHLIWVSSEEFNVSQFFNKISLLLGQDDNDSQQAAEAMIQLGYYSTNQQQQHDESIDFDPNYDPSDFLMKKDENEQLPVVVQQHQQQQVQYQESFEYAAAANIQGVETDEMQQQNYYGTFAQQSFSVNDFGFQQPQEDYSQQQQTQLQQQQMMIPSDGGGLADLEISDSDDEGDQNEELSSSQNPADTNKEEDGLWF